MRNYEDDIYYNQAFQGKIPEINIAYHFPKSYDPSEVKLR